MIHLVQNITFYSRSMQAQCERAKQGNETFALRLSEGRSSKDAAIWASHEQRLVADLEELQKRILRGFHTCTAGQITKPPFASSSAITQSSVENHDASRQW